MRGSASGKGGGVVFEQILPGLLSGIVVAVFVFYLEFRSRTRDKQEKTDRENLVLGFDKKITKVQTDLTAEIRAFYDKIVLAVNADYVRNERFLPIKENVSQLQRQVSDHGDRITRIEAQRET